MKNGFTIIELLIVIALIVILSTVGILTLFNFRSNQSLRLATQNLVTFVRSTQQKSISQESGLRWGIRFTHQAGGRDSYQLVSGVSTFNPAGDTVALPGGVEFAAVYEDVVFNRFGLPDSSSTIIMRLTGNPTVTRTITVNVQGTIEEQ